jgi:alanyl-tRNA synthetase
LYPSLKATKGHSFPNEGYVEFQGDEIPDMVILQAALNNAIIKGYKISTFEVDAELFQQKFYKLPYQTRDNKVFRVMQIEDFMPIPCGGTHLTTTHEIGNMILGKIKTKSGVVRISYDVT